MNIVPLEPATLIRLVATHGKRHIPRACSANKCEKNKFIYVMGHGLKSLSSVLVKAEG